MLTPFGFCLPEVNRLNMDMDMDMYMDMHMDMDMDNSFPFPVTPVQGGLRRYSSFVDPSCSHCICSLGVPEDTWAFMMLVRCICSSTNSSIRPLLTS